jgi:uncharacterized membrane protein
MYGPPPPLGYGPPMFGPPMIEPVPAWWWLFPILFSILGGLICFYMWKDRNLPAARNMLTLGVVMLVVNIVVYLFSPGCCFYYL